MKRTEPTRTWQDQQHQRIVGKDPIAFAQLCEYALEHLVSFLHAQFPGAAIHLPEMIAADCLMAYYTEPRQYDPERLSLFAFLRMAARGDMMNALDKERRQNKRLFNIDEMSGREPLMEEDGQSEESFLDEWLKNHTTVTRREIISTLNAKLDSVDRQILLLSLEGVRDSGRYAQIMKISHLAVPDQRKAVKRAKDRIYAMLRRMGAQLSEV